MASKKIFLIWWLGGLAIFAVSITIHSPLAIAAAPEGILDHQSAPDAASVNAIQQAWKKAGLIGQARLAMISDLIFIGIYGVGAVLGGVFYARSPNRALLTLGCIALVMGVVFLVTDYAETILQFVQLTAFEGDDTLAGIASKMGPFKVVSFLASAASLALALIWERLVRAQGA